MTDLSEGIQMKRWLSNILKVFKEKKNTRQPGILCPVKIALKNEDKIETFRHTKAGRVLHQQKKC